MGVGQTNISEIQKQNAKGTVARLLRQSGMVVEIDALIVALLPLSVSSNNEISTVEG
jgi:hypothetical protein